MVKPSLKIDRIYRFIGVYIPIGWILVCGFPPFNESFNQLVYGLCYWSMWIVVAVLHMKLAVKTEKEAQKAGKISRLSRYSEGSDSHNFKVGVPNVPRILSYLRIFNVVWCILRIVSRDVASRGVIGQLSDIQDSKLFKPVDLNLENYNGASAERKVFSVGNEKTLGI